LSLDKQVVILYSAINGYLDDVPLDQISVFETDFRRFMGTTHPEIGDTILREKVISEETEEALKKAIGDFKQGRAPAGTG
jgi:F-type H+-transporting ATPase subunit alpha